MRSYSWIVASIVFVLGLVCFLPDTEACPRRRIFYYTPGQQPFVVSPFCPQYSLTESTVQSTPPADVDERQQWPTIKGRLVFKGAKIPGRELIYLGKHPDPYIRSLDGTLFSEDWIVNHQNRGIKDAVIWLAPDVDSRRAPFPKESIYPKLVKQEIKEVEMSMRGCRFSPHVLAVRQGTSINFKSNGEPIHHHVKFDSLLNADFSVVIPTFGEQKTPSLVADPIALVVVSNILPWMKAYVRVLDHPYFAVSDENGIFEIKLAPKGKFRLYIWHPTNGWKDGVKGRFGQKIEVMPGVNDLGEISTTKNE